MSLSTIINRFLLHFIKHLLPVVRCYVCEAITSPTLSVVYVLKATIKDLQLRFGEVGLSFQLLQSLWPVTHHRHLEFIVRFICENEKQAAKGLLLGITSTSLQPLDVLNVRAASRRLETNQ